jgi:hypothetical protein
MVPIVVGGEYVFGFAYTILPTSVGDAREVPENPVLTPVNVFVAPYVLVPIVNQFADPTATLNC